MTYLKVFLFLILQFVAFRSQRRAGVLLAEHLGLLSVVEGLRDAVHLRGQFGLAEVAASNHRTERREIIHVMTCSSEFSFSDMGDSDYQGVQTCPS